jgi:hypothetical protein
MHLDPSWDHIIDEIIAAVVAGLILAGLSWAYAKRTFVYTWLQPLVRWLSPRVHTSVFISSSVEVSH